MAQADLSEHYALKHVSQYFGVSDATMSFAVKQA
jgi:hypothetical protein